MFTYFGAYILEYVSYRAIIKTLKVPAWHMST